MEPRLTLIRLAVAALGGLAVGIEREWSAHRDGDRTRFGGVRTFLLLGLVGGLAATVATESAVLGAIVFAAGAVLVVVAYLVSAWQGAIDATTEVAGIVVLTAGAMAGAGHLVVASAMFAATALVLVEKSRMHAAVGKLEPAELVAGARFAVLALVVLPLLPDHPVGPFGGIEPQQLWALVLLFSGLSFAGFVALRVAGPERGWGVAGLLGGLVSSTAVTLNFARESRVDEAPGAALGRGALAASTVLPLRVLALAAILNYQVAARLALLLVPALLVAGSFALLALRRPRGEAAREGAMPQNPLRLGSAIQMTLLFALMLWALTWIQERLGSGGLLGSAALLGLTDLDALTYSVSELAGETTPVELAARALLVGMLSNTLFKAGLAAVVGSRDYRRVCSLGLAGFALAYALGFALG